MPTKGGGEWQLLTKPVKPSSYTEGESPSTAGLENRHQKTVKEYPIKLGIG